MKFHFDIVVVGAGHAGVEASLASARLGHKTLLISTNLDKISGMSCNPSVGGLAKGHMVRELDILGGEMGKAADETCLQFKRLNSSKGPAVRGTRMQTDKEKYSRRMGEVVRAQENLSVLEGEVKKLELLGCECFGVVLQDGSVVRSKCTIITTGTFMNAVMHVGFEQTSGGRVGEPATHGLSDQLAAFGFKVQRLKTGTPPRLNRQSIDFSKTIEQWGDQTFYPFSFGSERQFKLQQVPCFLSRTTDQTHEIINKNLNKSPLYCGIIEGVGPRYCPSIEDKVVRFKEKTSHQTFLEPESLETDLIYLQGISTSLPRSVQDLFIRTIPGLENVRFERYGYAVEYDFVEPQQIFHSLETRPIKNLFLAGQINGTSGYEEAAVQGLIAGINASARVSHRSPLVLGRSQAYIGVLIDDLVTKGTQEPYRMFTSRAEHRLVLREDNTIDRLADVAADVGLVPEGRQQAMFGVRESRSALLKELGNQKLYPNELTQKKLLEIGSSVLLKSISYKDLLRRPEINCSHLKGLGFDHQSDILSDPNINDSVEIEVKYDGYIKRQNELIGQAAKFEETLLPVDLDYLSLLGLSAEEREKLNRVRPRTLGQAQRISGVNPSAIQSLLIFMRTRTAKETLLGKSKTRS